MKKLLFILALSMFSFANAQKGTVLVAGTVGFSSQKTSNSGVNSTQNSFSLFPKIGYQFTDNWTVGGEAGVSFQKSEYSSVENKVNGYSVGAFVRYSKPLSDLFLIYADLGMGYGGLKETYVNDFNTPTTTINKSNGFYGSIAPALAINIKKGFCLNFGFGGISYNARKYDSGNKVNGFNFNFGQSFSAGISKNF